MSSHPTEAPAPEATGLASRHGLEEHGIEPTGTVYWNLSPAELYEQALTRGEGRMVHGGGFASVTAPHTGRSPNDKFIVEEPGTSERIHWGKVNRPISRESFQALRELVVGHLEERDLFVRDVRAGAHDRFGLRVRVVTENAWHSLFAYNMFLRPSDAEMERMAPDYTVLHAPGVKADPEKHGTNSGAFIVVSYAEKEVLIGGTHYAGEIKKSIFSVLNLLLPEHGVLPMHCSANVGKDADVALFFGLSGTGKTTLSADPDRGLIGDDEHGWADDGVFNFEGGCYAKVINLSAKGEPEIYQATQMFGTILENVILDDRDRRIDYDDDTITENTRASYPIHYIPNAVIPGRAGHPRNVIFLTADAFGVLPPISKLTPEQAMYHFLSGYTAKVAGTERGVDEPKATFSACFGAPFLPLHPSEYAELLGAKLREHGADVWLVNTGWTAGPFGEGHRMELAYTRAMIRAVLSGRLAKVETQPDPIFGLHVPASVHDVPDRVLHPRRTWARPEAYDAQAQKLAQMFRDNFAAFESHVPEEVRNAGP